MALSSPDRFIAARYRLHEVLGQGGMGTVYRSTDTVTGQTVAVKALKPDLFGRDPEMIERFIREGDALRRLNHPNIVAMLDAAGDENTHYLVMEYVGGGSLADLLQKESRLPLAQLVQIALDLSDALTRAHRLNIIHRDIKPANVLIAADGTPRLTDFGVARIGNSDITQTGAVVGTLGYLAPEAFEAQPLDARSDIWSFGVMLFEMLAGHRPFTGDSPSAVIRSILMQPTPDLEKLCPDAPSALLDLIYRMLEKNRSARIPSVRLVGAELEAILSGAPLPVLPSAPPVNITVNIGEGEATERFTPIEVLTTPSARVKNNLPAQLTPFVGREREVAELVELLTNPAVPLATIVAPGGMGKTRLAQEVAARFTLSTTTALRAPLVEHGVYFIPLAPLTTPDEIVPEIATALNFSFASENDTRRHPQQLLDYLREKHLLLVMDNFEHLLDGAPFVNDIIQKAPAVKILATSRERLNLRAETLYPIEGMDFPDYETPAELENLAAAQLFLQSARRAQPGYELTADDRPYLARICRQVHGIPLAIELAAAWVGTLALAEISEEIGKSYDFLATDLRDVPERHRSMRAVFEYSWNLLSDEERRITAKTAVFRGTFTRDAVQEVTGASLRTLNALINKSLLRRSPHGRYEVHELLRQYAEEQLARSGEEESTRDRHAAYFTNFIAHRDAPLKDHRQIQAQAEIEAELENIKSGWLWAAQRSHAHLIFAGLLPLYVFFNCQNRIEENREILDKAAALLSPQLNEARAALMLVRLTVGAWTRAGFDQSEEKRRFYHQAHRLVHNISDEVHRASALVALARLANELDERADTERLVTEAIVLLEKHGDLWWLSGAKLLLAAAKAAYGEGQNPLLGLELLEESLEIARRSGNPFAIANRSNVLGIICWSTGDFARARASFTEAISLFKQMGNLPVTAANLWWLARTKLSTGEIADAETHLQESLSLYTEAGDRGGVAGALNGLGMVRMQQRLFTEAEDFFQRCLAIQTEIDNRFEISAVLSNLGALALETDQFDHAHAYFLQALAVGLVGMTIEGQSEALLGLATLSHRRGDNQKALVVLGFLAGQALVPAESEARAASLRQTIADTLPAETLHAALDRGRHMDFTTLMNTLQP